jgi:hypothetical protein
MVRFQTLKKIIFHPIRPQHTLSAAGTVKFPHALPAVRFSCLLRGSETSFQDGVASFKQPCIKFALHCNHISEHLKTEHTKKPTPAETPSSKLVSY